MCLFRSFTFELFCFFSKMNKRVGGEGLRERKKERKNERNGRWGLGGGNFSLDWFSIWGGEGEGGGYFCEGERIIHLCSFNFCFVLVFFFLFLFFLFFFPSFCPFHFPLSLSFLLYYSISFILPFLSILHISPSLCLLLSANA